jgi:hypothetical protein
MSQIKFNAPWHRLRHTWVGRTYAPEFFQPIKNMRVRESLQKIAIDTEEDYQKLIQTLEAFDIKVSRPQIDDDVTIMDFVNEDGRMGYHQARSYTLIPRPPMQPRDSWLIVGDSLLGTLPECQWFYPDCERSDQTFDAPLVTVIGQHLIADCRDHAWLPKLLSNRYPDRNVVPVSIGGHNDAVFCPLRPGLIVSTYHHDNYRETFPGWHVKYIENQSWNAIPGWRRHKHANIDKWWVPDTDNNLDFAEFVNAWLSHWVGHVQETVFDVNMLQIDEHTVLVNNHNQDMFDFFKKHKIEAIVVPFRHRFFWDGGIHCVTGDVYREGENDRYIDIK